MTAPPFFYLKFITHRDMESNGKGRGGLFPPQPGRARCGRDEAAFQVRDGKMTDMTRVFIHGRDSSSRGTKGSFFREKYPEMLIDDYTGALEERMAKLERGLSGRKDLILVGSSLGGLMATLFACNHAPSVRRLILLAPALRFPQLRAYDSTPLQLPVTLYHGKDDVVVPPEPVRQVAGKLFPNLDYHLVEDDHNLHRIFPTLDWDGLLEIANK